MKILNGVQHENNTPTICILVNSLIGGGAERIALVSLLELKRKGFKVVLVCLEKEEGYKIPKDVPVYFLTDFKKLKNPVVKVFWVFISAFRLANVVKKHHVHFIQSHLVRSNFINVLAKTFGARHKTQLVSHLPLSFSSSFFPMGLIKSAFYAWFYRRADEVVSISLLMKSEIEKSLSLEKHGVNHRVVYNPHNLKKVRKGAVEAPEFFSFDPTKRHLIVAGRLQPHKKVDVTIEALAEIRRELPDVELIVLGEGEDKTRLEEIAAKNGLTPFVHFLGRAANPHAYISRCEALILSSELEGLPNILIEAMACGTPVISSDCVSGPREILAPDTDCFNRIKSGIEYAQYGILYPVGNAGMLAKATLGLLRSGAIKEGYSEKGKNYVDKFDKENITSEYIRHLVPGLDELNKVKPQHVTV